MSTFPTIVLTAAGVLLIAAALRDVVDSLFHETGRAVLSEQVMRLVLRMATAGCSDGLSDPVRLRATMLVEAIDDFARTAADRFHGSAAESTDELLVDYARDHLVLSDEARS